MKTLELILEGYINGQYSLNEMKDIINETMQYRGYKSCYGKRSLSALVGSELITVTK